MVWSGVDSEREVDSGWAVVGRWAVVVLWWTVVDSWHSGRTLFDRQTLQYSISSSARIVNNVRRERNFPGSCAPQLAAAIRNSHDIPVRARQRCSTIAAWLPWAFVLPPHQTAPH